MNGVELARQEAPQVNKGIISHGATIYNVKKADSKSMGPINNSKSGLCLLTFWPIKPKLLAFRILSYHSAISTIHHPPHFIFSPTHKRTEGRAPVWGSEFTSKRRRTTRGDPVETAARLNVKLRTSVTDWWCVVRLFLLLFITQSFFESI